MRLLSAGVSRGRKKSLLQTIEKARAYVEADHIDLSDYRRSDWPVAWIRKSSKNTGSR